MKALAVLGAAVLLATMASAGTARQQDPISDIEARDARMIAAEVADLPRHVQGQTDLYAIGVAGDGTEDVFRNETEYFATLMRDRFHARGVLTLVSNPASVGAKPRPLATYDNLHDAVMGTARRMDKRQDILVLYLTMHGTPEHELALYYPPYVSDALVPDDLRYILDKAGIRNRVVVVSACYSGGFIPTLRGEGTLLITAAASDRPSFGCGADSSATFFGRAWLVEGLNSGNDFVQAFRHAEGRIREWERNEEFEASNPQISEGATIKARLADWRSHLDAGAPVPYPWPLDEAGEADGPGA